MAPSYRGEIICLVPVGVVCPQCSVCCRSPSIDTLINSTRRGHTVAPGCGCNSLESDTASSQEYNCVFYWSAGTRLLGEPPEPCRQSDSEDDFIRACLSQSICAVLWNETEIQPGRSWEGQLFFISVRLTPLPICTTCLASLVGRTVCLASLVGSTVCLFTP